jgi:hypothetical protein
VTIVSLYDLTGAPGARSWAATRLAAVLPRGLILHRGDLLDRLLRDVALQPWIERQLNGSNVR